MFLRCASSSDSVRTIVRSGTVSAPSGCAAAAFEATLKKEPHRLGAELGAAAAAEKAGDAGKARAHNIAAITLTENADPTADRARPRLCGEDCALNRSAGEGRLLVRSAGLSLAVAAGLAAAIAGYFALVPASPADKVAGGLPAAQPVCGPR